MNLKFPLTPLRNCSIFGHSPGKKWPDFGENNFACISNLRYADDTTLMAESEEELKILLMKVKRRVKKLA